MKSLFCANFSSTRGRFKYCQGSWCYDCYKARDLIKFSIQEKVTDFDSFLKEEDGKRFMVARPGDNIVLPFQCDLCHFRNIKTRNSKPNTGDDVLLYYVKRANLDAFWSRERSTVQTTCREVARRLKFAEELHLPNPFPSKGPLKLKD